MHLCLEIAACHLTTPHPCHLFLTLSGMILNDGVAFVFSVFWAVRPIQSRQRLRISSHLNLMRLMVELILFRPAAWLTDCFSDRYKIKKMHWMTLKLKVSSWHSPGTENCWCQDCRSSNGSGGARWETSSCCWGLVLKAKWHPPWTCVI